MWDSQKPLDLLMTLPVKLNKEHLENLQAVIDVDKIVNSHKDGSDLCGIYAPFCDFCDKNVQYPCANAYVKMMQNEGLEVEVPEYVYNSLKIKEKPAEAVAKPDEHKPAIEKKPIVSEKKLLTEKPVTESTKKPVAAQKDNIAEKPVLTHKDVPAEHKVEHRPGDEKATSTEKPATGGKLEFRPTPSKEKTEEVKKPVKPEKQPAVARAKGKCIRIAFVKKAH